MKLKSTLRSFLLLASSITMAAPALADVVPISTPGGPYLVLVSGNLSLNGSGTPSDTGTTITTYEWDLDNDGDFDELITTATPAAIPYATLTGTYGMFKGSNTIRLRVTDDSLTPLSTTTTTTVVLDTTTYTGASGTASATDTWNIAGRWNAGIPAVSSDAVIAASKYVVVNATTAAYTGSLSIGSGSTLQIGWTTVDATRYNALGNGNVTMAAGSSILTRNEGTMNFTSLTLTGNASIRGGDSTQRGTQMNFGAISGAHTLSLYNHNANFTTGNTNLNAANSFSSLVLTATDNTSSTVFAKVAGSLGSGDVTLDSGKLTFGTAAGAVDIMANTGVLRINGSGNDRVTMTASDTIGGAFVNGAKQLPGVYTGAETWLAGAGTLTVLGATSAYWDIDDSVAGAGGAAPAGTWGGTSNWSSAAAGNVTTTTWTAGQNAIFAAGTGATGTYGVTVSGTQAVAGLGFEEGNVTLSGDALNLTETAPVVVKTGASAIIESVISENVGPFALHKSGAGALTLSGANTYTGGTVITEGTLNINAAGVAGVSGPLGNGGSFTINGGTIDNTSGSAKVLLNVNPITVGGNFTFSTASGTANNNLTLPGPVNLGTRTITTNGAGVLTLSGNISNAILTKAGVGTLVLSGANTYTGTTVNSGGGTVIFKGANALPPGILQITAGTTNTFRFQRDTAYAGSGTNGIQVFNNGIIGNFVFERETPGAAVNYAFSSGTNGNFDISGGATAAFSAGANITSGTPTVTINQIRSQGGDTNGIAAITATGVDLSIGTLTATNNGANFWTLGGTSTGNVVTGAISHPVNKQGAGTWTLSSSSNAYAGATTITGGTLKLGANNVLPNASNVSIGTATLDADTRTDTVGTLDATGNAVINLGTGAALAFANSSGVDWSGNPLDVTGTLGATSLRFGTDNTGLTPAQLALISVNGSGTGTYILDASGYLVAGGGGPGPVDNFLISAIASPQTVGTAITGITITARDSSNATATGFTGTVTFGGTGGFTGTSGTFTAGVLSGVSVTPTVAGSNLTFTVDDGASHTGSVTITTIQTQYQAWAGGGLFDADANNDGVSNGMAFLLGAAGPSSAVTLPTFTYSGGDLILSNFSSRNSASRGTATLSVEHSGDLGISDPWTTVTVPEMSGGPTSGVNFNITPGSPLNTVNSATILSSQAVAGKLFGRLKATE